MNIRDEGIGHRELACILQTICIINQSECVKLGIVKGFAESYLLSKSQVLYKLAYRTTCALICRTVLSCHINHLQQILIKCTITCDIPSIITQFNRAIVLPECKGTSDKKKPKSTHNPRYERSNMTKKDHSLTPRPIFVAWVLLMETRVRFTYLFHCLL